MRSILAELPDALARVVGRVAGRSLTPGAAAWLAGVPALLLLGPAMIPGQPFWLGLPAFVVVMLVARWVPAGHDRTTRGENPGTGLGQVRPIDWTVPFLVLLVLAGVAMRLLLFGDGWSGVLAVTTAAIERVGGGLSPWNVPYPESIPPGEPFPYGPTVLAWYWPLATMGLDLRWMELTGSCALLIALAVSGRPIGLTVAALAPVLAMVASDGSNDTSAGMVLLGALLLVKRGVIRGGTGERFIGGAALGIAGAFKFHALAWVPGLVAFGGTPALIGLLASSLTIWAPALVLAGPGSILASLRWAESLHSWAGWSLAGVMESVLGERLPAWPFAVTRWVGGAMAVGLVLLAPWRRRPARWSWAAYLAGGLLVFLVVLYAGYWSTHGYLAQVAPILCWELDALAGGGRSHRIAGSARSGSR